jgi:hypothetical protein
VRYYDGLSSSLDVPPGKGLTEGNGKFQKKYLKVVGLDFVSKDE